MYRRSLAVSYKFLPQNPETDMSGTIDSITEQYPIRRGAVLGATAALGVLSVGFLFSGFSVGGAVVMYYVVHLWPLLLGGAGSGMALVLVFSLVPIVILLTSGYQLASESDHELSGFRKGATVTVGYALIGLVALGALFAGAGVSSIELALVSLLIRQNVVVAVLFTGVLVPATFGGLGGIFADS